jgi:hypothetical protein
MDHIELSVVIIIAFVIWFVVTYMSYTLFRLKLHAAVALGAIVGFLLVNTMYPIGVLMYERRSFVITLYLLFEFIIPLYLLFYLICLIMTSHRRN